jgi:integrase
VALLEQAHSITGKFDLVFAEDPKPWKPMSENTVNAALRTMGYDSKVDICGHGFRAMACSALIESGLWSETAIERQMSHKERNNLRAAYIHKAEFLEERRMIMTWWSRFLEANREHHVTPYEFAKQAGENVTRIRSARRAE